MKAVLYLSWDRVSRDLILRLWRFGDFSGELMCQAFLKKALSLKAVFPFDAAKPP